MEKILTIVIPTYNMESYLRKCLDSLIIDDKDLFERLEVLVINDGSKDASSAIAHEYQDKYPHVIRVIDKENGHYGSCVNQGLKEASGVYFRILDADDWFATDGLQEFLNVLQECDADIVLTNYTRLYVDNRQVNKEIELFKPNKVYTIDKLEDSYPFCKYLFLMYSMTFRRIFLKGIQLELQTGICYTDIEYCYFPLSKAKTLIFYKINLYQYLSGRDGQSMQRDNIIQNVAHLYKVATRVVNDYLTQKDVSAWRKLAMADVISHPVNCIFEVFLLYQRDVSDDLKRIVNSIERLVDQDMMLLHRLESNKYRNIPYVLIWKKLHFRLAPFLLLLRKIRSKRGNKRQSLTVRINQNGNKVLTMGKSSRKLSKRRFMETID